MILDPGALGFGDVAAFDEHDTDIGENLVQVTPDRLLVFREPGDRLVDPHQLLGGRQPVRAALGDAFTHLRLETGDADHEELIKVIRRNRQEPDPLQGGVARIDRFLQHTAIEMQPGKFPVNEALGKGTDCGKAGVYIFFFCSNGLCGFHEVLIHFMSSREAIASSMGFRGDVSMTLMFPPSVPSRWQARP